MLPDQSPREWGAMPEQNATPGRTNLAVEQLSHFKLCRPLRRMRRSHCKCISTDKPPKRPDPAIYSQWQRLTQGVAASWESPDIKTNWWEPWRFMDSVEVTVRNESNEASAVNTLVQVSWAPFGIGTTFSPLGAQLISLGLAPDEKTMLLTARPLPSFCQRTSG